MLKVEQRLDRVLCQVTGTILEPSAFETAEGEKIYLEMQSIREEKIRAIVDADGDDSGEAFSSEEDTGEEVGDDDDIVSESEASRNDSELEDVHVDGLLDDSLDDRQSQL